jgi:thymidylate synthase (FAD)
MRELKVILVTKPDFDPLAMIGGLARLTQIKDEFNVTSHERGLAITKAIHQMGHTSLLECGDFGFIFVGASRVFLAQITRHRMASYTSGSQQYQDHDDFPYVIPDSILHNSGALSKYMEIMGLINECYIALKLEVGRDDARYVLPGAARNNLYAKFNARELITAVIPQRLCRRNTAETMKWMRLMMHELIIAGFGELFSITGPACITTGKCDQAKMSCGRPFESWEDMLYGD